MKRWTTQWLTREEGGETEIPAYDFLLAITKSPRIQLLSILEAVKSVGPDAWLDANSHARMKGNLAHLHELRDKQGETLYRVFIRWNRDAKEVVIIDGREKANNTTISDKEYKAIEKLAATIDNDPPPFATVDDFIQKQLKDEEDEDADGDIQKANS